MYKIIAGSSCDLTEEMKKELDIDLVPFTITIDGKEYLDDENIDLRQMIDDMNKSKEAVQTACPAPGAFLQAFEGHENIFVVTISSNLSGAYNSAMLARDMALEKDPDKLIHVFDSESASAGETLVALKIKEEIDKGISREEIIKNVDTYIGEIQTFFILESLNNLIKNGRISRTSGLIANVLNFKPIMSDDGSGSIVLFEKVRGQNRAFNRLVDAISEKGLPSEGRKLAITHVDALERAEKLKRAIEEKYNFEEILIVQTAGLCSAYADDGGIVMVY